VASLVGGPGGPWPFQNFRIFLFLKGTAGEQQFAYHGLFILSGKFHETFVRKISCRSCHGIFMSFFIFYFLSGKFYEKFVRKISCRNCHGIFMSLHFQ
jgi:hypothetical protein